VGRDFPHPSTPALWPTQPRIQGVPDLFPGVKRPKRGVNHPLSSSDEVKERVELKVFGNKVNEHKICVLILSRLLF
jgi:hypothetical protein